MKREQIDTALERMEAPSSPGNTSAGAIDEVIPARRGNAQPRPRAASDVVSGLVQRLTPRSSPEPDPRDARADARARIDAERRALEPRIRRDLLSAIRRTPTPCALLHGPSGSGKTSAALWLTVCLSPLIARASRLASAPRRHGLGAGDAPELARAMSARLLVLDDLGTEDPADLRVLQDLIDHRYASGRPIIATTGLEPRQLSAHIGAPYVRRLVEQHVRRRAGGECPVLVIDLFAGKR